MEVRLTDYSEPQTLRAPEEAGSRGGEDHERPEVYHGLK